MFFKSSVTCLKLLQRPNIIVGHMAKYEDLHMLIVLQMLEGVRISKLNPTRMLLVTYLRVWGCEEVLNLNLAIVS